MKKQHRHKKYQRGSVDLMQVAVAFLMITVAVVGTTYAMFYGRQAIIRQEHRKVALYHLRQYVEEWTGRILIEASKIPPGEMLGGSDTQVVVDLDDSSVPERAQVKATISRESTLAVDLPETGEGIDYYRLGFTVTWREYDGTDQSVLIRTSMVQRN
ncbi:hypothetical protein KKG05_07390 [bacterium]|nr:hypothetical protein [bacterium]